MTDWYRALAPVEHNGARFKIGDLVSGQHPAVAAHSESFEPVGDPIYIVRPRPAVYDVRDGTTRPMAPAPGIAMRTSRRPGRPAWDTALFRQRYGEAVAATPAPRTPGRIADNFVRLDGTTGIDPDTLARLLRTHGA